MGIKPREVISVNLKEGSYYGTVYQNIGLSFDNGVLAKIIFPVYGTADEIDRLMAFFREEFSQYCDYEVEKPTLGGGISHHQVFFDDGLTTIMLWKRDYSQCERGEYSLPTDINLEVSIVSNEDKPEMDYLHTICIKKPKKAR